MNRIVLALLAIMGFVPFANATTFIVPTSNNDRMVSVMDSVQAGDIVYINDGTYTEPPLPTHDGTEGNPIKIIGNTVNPTAVKCAPWGDTTELNGRDYVEWRAIYFTGSVALNGMSWDGTDGNAAIGDVLRKCYIHGGVRIAGLLNGGVDSSIIGYQVNGDVTLMAVGVFVENAYSWCYAPPTGSFVTNCTIYGRLYTNSWTSNPGMHPIDFEVWNTSMRQAGYTISGFTFSNNTIQVVFVGSADPTGGDTPGAASFYATNGNTFDNNTFSYYDSTSYGVKPSYVWYCRDNTRNNTISNSTYTVNNGRFLFAFSVSGNAENYKWVGNTYTNDKFIHHGIPADEAFWEQGFLDGETFSYCVFQTDSSKTHFLLNGNFDGNITFDHDTFFAPFASNAIYVDPVSSTWVGKLSIRNSILYTRNTSTDASDIPLLIGILPTASQLDLDHNLYSRYGTTSANQPYLSINGIYYYNKWPESADSAICTRGQGNTEWDCNSKWGSPRFTDSTTTTFNAQTDMTGRGYLAGESSSNIGANNDNVRPAAITDFSLTELSETSVRLDWTAVGDDSLSGSRCMLYDMRYSNSLITSSNFNSAAQITNEPLPTAPGTSQSMTISIVRGADYYFAIKSRDEIPHWSAISNVVARAGGVMGQ